MRKIKRLTSVNIIRDQDRTINYFPSENSRRIAQFILDEFYQGIHSFNLIGSYGTGKSSFMWAFNQSISLNSNKDYFHFGANVKRPCRFINIVGEYNSLIQYFVSHFSIKNDLKGNQEIFDCIFQEYENVKSSDGLLIINIDEFGKFLEFAVENNPEKEMYFIQQLTEFVNDPDRNILLLTSVHQGIDSYAYNLTENQKNEWKKVKGRFHEIPFNEPVEQLLFRASQYLSSVVIENDSTIKYLQNLFDLNNKQHCFNLNKADNLPVDLYPLDLFSAYVIAISLQRYGQNERSLFTFLQTADHLGLQTIDEGNVYDLPKVYDYLFINLYSLLVSHHNPDYSKWALIKSSIERAESSIDLDQIIAIDLIKSLGLLEIFAKSGASLNDNLLIEYLSNKYDPIKIRSSIKTLEKHKIIRFNKFNKSYKLYGGSDLDIEEAIIRVGNDLDKSIDIVSKLESFEFPIITAKENSYVTGTPRLFEFKVSESPINETALDEIDGFINLIFNENISDEELIESSNHEKAILYASYANTSRIKDILLDIRKTEQVFLEVDQDDKVAKNELNNIIHSQKTLLNHYVIDSLFSDRVRWYFNGQHIQVGSKKELNQKLSEICDQIYYSTPTINMELINKHKVSGAINSARKLYFHRLVNNWNEDNLGYPDDKFPADKTIYLSLFKRTGIHRESSEGYNFTEPNGDDQNLISVWEQCKKFINDARLERKSVIDLIDRLKKAPYKLKQGVIDFLVPTFLFSKRGDFALYNKDGGFLPQLKETNLYLITRNPHEYEIKSFELSDLRLDLFNKYRSFLGQQQKTEISNTSFIESIKPFLILYRNLNDYSKKTKRLSKQAISIRESIKHATDPESIFFDKFPNALGYDLSEINSDSNLFDKYIVDLQRTIQEINNSYKALLNRIERYLNEEILGLKVSFPSNKEHLIERFTAIKEHQVLGSQRTLLARINSGLNDRDSWISSIAFAVLGKPLDQFNDSDEKFLKDNLEDAIKELDNLCDIEKLDYDRNHEEVYRLDFTSKDNGLKKHLVRVSKSQQEEILKKVDQINKQLGDDKQKRIAILSALLKKELGE